MNSRAPACCHADAASRIDLRAGTASRTGLRPRAAAGARPGPLPLRSLPPRSPMATRSLQVPLAPKLGQLAVDKTSRVFATGAPLLLPRCCLLLRRAAPPNRPPGPIRKRGYETQQQIKRREQQSADTTTKIIAKYTRTTATTVTTTTATTTATTTTASTTTMTTTASTTTTARFCSEPF